MFTVSLQESPFRSTSAVERAGVLPRKHVWVEDAGGRLWKELKEGITR